MAKPDEKFYSISSKVQIKKIFVLFFFWCIIFNGCKRQIDGVNLYPVTINEKTVYVEIADTPEKRQLGLMYRQSLPENQGMLFIFENEQVLSFWMKNTRIALSLAYISKDGTITEIISMEPYDQRSYKSKHVVQYALEMNRGWFEINGISVGDKIDLPDAKKQFRSHSNYD
ncbi:MAG: DUF192 domain-containing protein [Candidatus Auribacterota bacterium]|jgi:uncharacterized membrane protein (UPF0127 family)|nr:DUF192 domain-containing protein [Candidatus Auribacterota bacterium]